MERQLQRIKFPNRIRQAIIETGYTIEEVAKETGIPRRSLYDYCAGRTKIARGKVKLIAQLIGCSSTDLVPTVSIKDAMLFYGYEQTNLGECNLDRLRRVILDLLVSGSSLTLPELSDTWERLAYTLNNPYHIDETALAKLEQLTNVYWELYRGAIAKTDLLSGLQGHLETIIRLLHASQPEIVLRRLCNVASNTAQIIGEIYLDLEDIKKAEGYYQFALDIATEGNDLVLQALALGRKAFILMHTSRPQEALPCLREAYTRAEGQATGKSLAWITMMEAEAFSNIPSDAEDTILAIEKTESIFKEKKKIGNDSEWTGFNGTSLAAYKGACLLRIRQPEQARETLAHALQGLPTGPTRREALILADIAKSFVLQGEIEEACKMAQRSLASAARAKSIRALQEVRVVQKLLAPWKNQPEVKRLSQQLKVVRFL